MSKRKVIVFGINHTNTLGLIRSLGEAGYPVVVLLEPCNLKFCFLRFSKYISTLYHLKNSAEGVRILKDLFADEADKPIVFCGSDSSMSLVDAHYEELKDFVEVFNARGEQGRINHFMNKVNTFELAGKAGLTLIKTWRMRKGDVVPADMVYPCLIKGNNSIKSSKKDMLICQNEEELLSSMRFGVDYLVQEYVIRDYEVNVNALSIRHGEIVIVPAVIHKIRDSVARQGEFLRLDSAYDCPQINIDGIKTLVRTIGYEGLFSVEFLVKGDKAYFLEINLRNDGLNYIYTAAGMNLPKCWVESYAESMSWRECVQVRTPFYLMVEHDIRNVFEKKLGFFQWCRDFIRSEGFFVLSCRDPLPALYMLYIPFRQAWKKFLRKVA